MTSKIKQFKGSLNPVFDDLIIHQSFEEEASENNKIIKSHLPINRIKPRKEQPRKYFNEESLNELAQSIETKGVIQPIVVRPTHDGFYEIIVGERRWRASKLAGLDEMPVIVRDYSKSDGMFVSLIENIQRDNLNPLEQALAINELIEECSMTHAEVAESIGKSRATVSNLVRLLSLDPEVKAMVHASLLEMGHARALLNLSGKKQVDTAKLVVAKSLSVRETERLTRTEIKLDSDKSFKLDPFFEEKTARWKKEMSQLLSSKVNLHFGAGGKGKMVIHFESTKDADWLIEHLDIKSD